MSIESQCYSTPKTKWEAYDCTWSCVSAFWCKSTVIHLHCKAQWMIDTIWTEPHKNPRNVEVLVRGNTLLTTLYQWGKSSLSDLFCEPLFEPCWESSAAPQDHLKTAGGHNTHDYANPRAIAHARDVHQSRSSHRQLFVYSEATWRDGRWTALDF